MSAASDATASKLAAGTPRIRCVGVSKHYHGRPILDGVDLEIRTGEILGIIGPGGHGKSVLLKHLPRLVAPDAGQVLVDGHDLAKLSAFELARLREGFGYLFQNYALFDFMTVADNVAFPLRQEHRHSPADIDAAVAARLAEVGLTHAGGQYPRELSGGMKKRVGLARATISDPSIALYDDPTAGLDPVTSSRIFALIARMHAKTPGCATVVVSHDIDRMRPICHRYVMVEEGRIVFDGSEAALASAPRAVHAFFFGEAQS